MNRLIFLTLCITLANTANAQDRQKDSWEGFPIVTSSATTLAGRAIALDGDTILLTPSENYSDRTPIRIRLWGIDAPEMANWPWGPRARSIIDVVLRDSEGVKCERKGRHQNRIVAQCFAVIGGDKPTDNPLEVDIGRVLIASGYAVEHRRFGGGHYLDQENVARANKRGVWKGGPVGPAATKKTQR